VILLLKTGTTNVSAAVIINMPLTVNEEYNLISNSLEINAYVSAANEIINVPKNKSSLAVFIEKSDFDALVKSFLKPRFFLKNKANKLSTMPIIIKQKTLISSLY